MHKISSFESNFPSTTIHKTEKLNSNQKLLTLKQFPFSLENLINITTFQKNRNKNRRKIPKCNNLHLSAEIYYNFFTTNIHKVGKSKENFHCSGLLAIAEWKKEKLNESNWKAYYLFLKIWEIYFCS